jgi:hypothetical protein
MPNPGDVQGKAAAGSQLIQQLQDGDTDSLLQAGISLADNILGGSKIGGVLLGGLSGALSGFAMAGPTGAVIGFTIATVEGITTMNQGADAVTETLGLSYATNTITGNIAALAAMGKDLWTGNPQGWAMADYCAFAFPPNTSKNAAGLETCMTNIAQYVVQANPAFSSTGYTDLCSGTYWPTMGPGQSGGSVGVTTAGQLLRDQVPLCTPVWFDWYNPSTIKDCSQFLYFGSGGACPAVLGSCGSGGATPEQLKTVWLKAMNAANGLSAQQIYQQAVAQLPDRLYWSSDLYGVAGPSGSSGFATTLYNVDLINAMATVLMMRSCGASTQAIVSELLIQTALLVKTGGHDVNGNAMPGDVTLNQYGFHRFVDDHIKMANAQNAAANPPLVTSTGVPLSTSGMLGAVTAGVTGTILAGILGYSAYTRTSPLVVTRNAYGRVVQAGGKVRRLF